MTNLLSALVHGVFTLPFILILKKGHAMYDYYNKKLD